MRKIVLFSIIFFIVLLIPVFFIEKRSNKDIWIHDASASVLNMSNSAKKAYKLINKENDYSSLKFIALLSYQKVEGINFMYLAYDEKAEIPWKIVTIYLDKFNHATLTNIKDFDYTKYVNKVVLDQSKDYINNWEIYTKTQKQKMRGKAKKDLKKIKYDDHARYIPIALLGKKDSSMSEYAFFCLVKKNETYSFKIVTVESGKDVHIKSIAAFNIEDFIN